MLPPLEAARKGGEYRLKSVGARKPVEAVPLKVRKLSRLITHLDLRVVGRAEIAVSVLTIRYIEIEALGDRHVQLDESRLYLATAFDRLSVSPVAALTRSL